jgi:hypothetical protein
LIEPAPPDTGRTLTSKTINAVKFDIFSAAVYWTSCPDWL